jgi:50S ribosomal protein L16 3-hydroxylase
MDIALATPLLGGLSPQVFMRRHWQRKPLLVRQALPGVVAPVSRVQLFDLALRDDIESRLIVQRDEHWTLRHGPLRRRAIPSTKRARWTLLVQGLDLHVAPARELLERFRFVSDARLDDVMLSYATDGGGVGPHLDSYDVFLLQVQGTRRWRIGRVTDPQWQPDAPLKILNNFVAEQEWLLEPGDVLYLPPRWAHDGVARGECMTCSIGFRAPERSQLGVDLLQRLLDAGQDADRETRYRDAREEATPTPARIPAALQAFAAGALVRALTGPRRVDAALGELLSEPKPQVGFEPGESLRTHCGVALDSRTRMLYDRRHIFVNGESYHAAGRDATLMRRLADRRALAWHELQAISPQARGQVDEWARAGWLHAERTE